MKIEQIAIAKLDELRIAVRRHVLEVSDIRVQKLSESLTRLSQAVRKSESMVAPSTGQSIPVDMAVIANGVGKKRKYDQTFLRVVSETQKSKHKIKRLT